MLTSAVSSWDSTLLWHDSRCLNNGLACGGLVRTLDDRCLSFKSNGLFMLLRTKVTSYITQDVKNVDFAI